MSRRFSHVTIRIDRDDPAPEELRGYFSRVIAGLNADSRPVLLKVCTRTYRKSVVSIDLSASGRPVFGISGRDSVTAGFPRRWIAEHEVPLVFSKRGRDWLVLTPAAGDCVRVRRATLLERWFR